MSKELEKLNQSIFLINNDMWWSKEDVPAYEYLKKDNDNMMDSIVPFLKGNDVAVQAGAHCGFVIKKLETYFKRIYTFEPNNSMFLAMCMNISNPNVFKFQACLGDENKLVAMSKFPGQGSGADFVEGDGMIPMIMIDNLNLDKCDLIELDTEGYEYYALLGASNTIKKFKPLLCLERYWGVRAGVAESTMDDLLKSWGYVHVSQSSESDHVYQFQG